MQSAMKSFGSIIPIQVNIQSDITMIRNATLDADVVSGCDILYS